MPQPPNVDGLPIWLQILVSFVFVSTTAGVAFAGYRRRVEREPRDAATTVLASFPDMSAVRHLSDVCIELIGAVQSLDRCMADLTHHERNHVDCERELCMRLRELREVMERRSP